MYCGISAIPDDSFSTLSSVPVTHCFVNKCELVVSAITTLSRYMKTSKNKLAKTHHVQQKYLLKVIEGFSMSY